jgi:hypothetical protein
MPGRTGGVSLGYPLASLDDRSKDLVLMMLAH